MNVNKTTAILVLFLLTYSVSASAGLTGQGVLDQVITEFSTRSSAWATVISTRASNLFWGLTAFSMIWTFGPMPFKPDHGNFWLEVIRYSVFIGFFAFLLESGPTIAMSIMNSLRKIGAEASGTGNTDLSPSDIVDVGFMIWNQAIENFSSLNVVDSIVGAALSIVILVILALIATNMLLLIVSSWVLAYAGAFLLGFGSTRWTNDMAISYFKTVLGVGMQLLTMVLLIGIGKDLLVSFYDKMSKGSLNAEELGVMMIVSIVLFNLTNKIPPMIGGIVSGGGGGIGNYGAGAAIGAAMTAVSMGGAAMAKAAGALTSAATSVAGAMDAVKAASGSGGGESGGMDGNSRDSEPMMKHAQSSQKEDGGAMLAAKMDGGQRPISESIASRLGSGIKDAAKSKAGEIKQNFADKVSQTAGGKVASTIRATDAAYNSGITFPDGGADNSLSAANEQPSPMDPSEADAFVNKS